MEFGREQWKEIKGYHGKYFVSDQGRVYSIFRGRLLKPYEKRDGYLVVSLCCDDGKVRYERVHRLVALHFCHKPEGCSVVNHLDLNTKNNLASNLEWTTIQGNTKHAYEHSEAFQRNQRIASKKGADKMLKRIRAYRDGVFIGEFLGKENCSVALGISPKTIYNRLHGKFSSRSGYDFEEVMPNVSR